MLVIDSIRYVFYTISKLFAEIPFKLLSTAVVVMGNFLFGLESSVELHALLFLIFVDTLTGVLGAKISGEEIKSAKFFRVALKIVTYFLLVAAAFNTEKIMTPVLMLDETVLAFIGATELISILENAGKMGFVVPNKLLNKLHELRDNK